MEGRQRRISGPSLGGLAVDYIVTINPVPVASASDEAICSGQSTNVTITDSNSVSGTTFRWTIVGQSNVTGASNSSGSVISQLLTSTDGINTGTVNYLITPKANGCDGTPVAITVTVSPKPVMTNAPATLFQEICSAVTLNFIPTSTVVGTIYNWSSSVIGSLVLPGRTS